MKIITLSFDDGEIFDIRLADLLRKYNLKATFYLCSAHRGLEGDLPTGRHYKKVYTDILSQTYDGFEIGAHGANHRGFTKISEAELIDSIIADIKTFTPYTRKPIICCAYPGGATNETVIEILQRTQPVMFARTVCKDGKLFDSPTNPYLCVPSVHLFDENIDNIKGAMKIKLEEGKKDAYYSRELVTIYRDVPLDDITFDSNFRLASVSKQFIAFAIVNLINQGDITFDTKITSIFNQLPSYFNNITIKHLLNHTSGIYDYEDMEESLDE